MDSDRAVVISGRVAPVPVGFGYRLALGAVAVAMVLLPLIYVAIAAAAAVGVVAYVLTVWPNFAEIAGGIYGILWVGIGPPFAGTVLVWFMLRSMWPRRRPRLPGRTLSERDTPRLHALVYAVADALGAPRPREIRIDLQVNASAGVRRGWIGLLRRELVLTLGLPLAAAFSVEQVAGIVAHELGHFAQRGGMGVSYVIRSVRDWFARVVYERTSLDVRLERHSRRGILLRVVVQLARLVLWLSRRLLAGLMYLGAALSAALARQMELDADRYEARLVGSRLAGSTLIELSRLDFAGRVAWNELAGRWRDRRLTDDLPALIADHRARLPAEVIEGIDRDVAARKRAWHESHPTPAERLASLAAEPAEGILADPRPARELFPDFAGLCRRATIAEYRERLGEEFSPEQLVDLSAIESARARERADVDALTRRFGATLSRRRPVPIDLDSTRGAERATLADELARLDAEHAAERETFEPLNSRYAEVDDRLDGLAALAALEEARLARSQWGDRSEVAKLLGEAGAPDDAIRTAMGERTVLGRRLSPVDRRNGRRFALAIALADREAGAPDAEERAGQRAALVRALATLDATLEPLRDLRRALAEVRALWTRFAARRRDQRLGARLDRAYAQVPPLLEKVHRQLHGEPNPLSVDAATSTLQEFVAPRIPEASAVVDTLRAADEALDRAIEIRLRCLTRLASLLDATAEAPAATRAVESEKS